MLINIYINIIRYHDIAIKINVNKIINMKKNLTFINININVIIVVKKIKN